MPLPDPPIADLDSLILCSATLLPDPTRPQPDSLSLQVEAARAAGFAGISLWSLHEAAARSGGVSAEAIRDQIFAAGLSVPMVEAIMPWEAADDTGATRAALETLELARDYGAKYVAAVTLASEISSISDAARRLRSVCDCAADHGVQIALEFLPWTGIPDLATAWQIVEGAERPNAAIMLDGWHWQRQPGGPCADLLRTIPPEFIAVFQLSDAAARASGDAMSECMTARALPGEGAVDLRALLGVLAEIGARPLIAPEIFNRVLAEAGAEEMARSIHAASVKVLGG